MIARQVHSCHRARSEFPSCFACRGCSAYAHCQPHPWTFQKTPPAHARRRHEDAHLQRNVQEFALTVSGSQASWADRKLWTHRTREYRGAGKSACMHSRYTSRTQSSTHWSTYDDPGASVRRDPLASVILGSPLKPLPSHSSSTPLFPRCSVALSFRRDSILKCFNYF